MDAMRKCGIHKKNVMAVDLTFFFYFEPRTHHTTTHIKLSHIALGKEAITKGGSGGAIRTSHS